MDTNEDKIILELKSVEEIINTHRSQALNYLKATRLTLAIILNFGKNGLEHERLVQQNGFFNICVNLCSFVAK